MGKLFVTKDIETAEDINPVPSYGDLKNRVNVIEADNLEKMSVVTGEEILNDSILNEVEKAIFEDYTGNMFANLQSGSLSNVARHTSTQKTLMQKLTDESKIVNNVSKICKNVKDFGIGEQLKEMQDSDLWLSNFNNALNDVQNGSDVYKAMLSCKIADSDLVRNEILKQTPKLAKAGNADALLAVYDKYGPESDKHYPESLLMLVFNMVQSGTDINLINNFIKKHNVLKSIFITDETKGFDEQHIKDLKKALKEKSPIGDLLKTDGLTFVQTIVAKVKQVTNKSDAYVYQMFKNSEEKKNLRMAKSIADIY